MTAGPTSFEDTDDNRDRLAAILRRTNSNVQKTRMPAAVEHRLQQTSRKDYGLSTTLAKFVNSKEFPHWDASDLKAATLDQHTKKFEMQGVFVQGFVAHEDLLFYLSLAGAAQKKMEDYSESIQSISGYPIYGMPVEVVRAQLVDMGLGHMQASCKTFMIAVLYVWYPVEDEHLYALMLAKSSAIFWRDAEGGAHETVMDFDNRLGECETIAAREMPGVQFWTAHQRRLKFVEGLPLQLKQYATAGIEDYGFDLYKLLEFFDPRMTEAEETRFYTAVFRQYNKMVGRGDALSKPSAHPPIPTAVLQHTPQAAAEQPVEIAAIDMATASCHNCGQVGHFKRECPTARTTTQASTKRNTKSGAKNDARDAQRAAQRVEFATIWAMAPDQAMAVAFLAMSNPHQNIMLNWLQNNKVGLKKPFRSVAQQTANYVGDDAERLALLMAATFQTRTGSDRYMPTFSPAKKDTAGVVTSAASSQMQADDTGKTLADYDPQLAALMAKPLNELATPDSLRQQGAHYVTDGGVDKPQCFICLQTGHHACACDWARSVQSATGGSPPPVSEMAYPGRGRATAHAIATSALEMLFRSDSVYTEAILGAMIPCPAPVAPAQEDSDDEFGCPRFMGDVSENGDSTSAMTQRKAAAMADVVARGHLSDASMTISTMDRAYEGSRGAKYLKGDADAGGFDEARPGSHAHGAVYWEGKYHPNNPERCDIATADHQRQFQLNEDVTDARHGHTLIPATERSVYEAEVCWNRQRQLETDAEELAGHSRHQDHIVADGGHYYGSIPNKPGMGALYRRIHGDDLQGRTVQAPSPGTQLVISAPCEGSRGLEAWREWNSGVESGGIGVPQVDAAAQAVFTLTRTDKKLIVIYVRDQRFVCMIDSGAEITTATADAARRMPGQEVQASPYAIDCVLADGTQAVNSMTQCVTQVPLSHHNLPLCLVPVMFVVPALPPGVDILMGRDIIDRLLFADISARCLKCFMGDGHTWQERIDIPYTPRANDRRLDPPTPAPKPAPTVEQPMVTVAAATSLVEVEYLSGADFDALVAAVDIHNDTALWQQAESLLPKHRSGKHKAALLAHTQAERAGRDVAGCPDGGLPLSAMLSVPAPPGAVGYVSPQPHVNSLMSDAKRFGGMGVRFGSALLQLTVAMLAVSSYSLGASASTVTAGQHMAANTSTWTGCEDPQTAEPFIKDYLQPTPYLQHGDVGYQPLDIGTLPDRWESRDDNPLVTAATAAMDNHDGRAMAEATGAVARFQEPSDLATEPKYGPSVRAEKANFRHMTPKAMLARLREDGVDDGVQMKELRSYMDSLPVQPEGTGTQNEHHPPPEGDQRGYIPEPLVGTPDPSELTWVQAAIANIKRWSCLTPMTVFRPPAHHRRLKLELADNASIPRSDPRGTAIGFRELDKTFVKGLLEQQRIQPSNSPVGSPMVFVAKPKKNETDPTRFRCCIDFRRINECLKPQSYRLPAMDSLWYSMDQAEWISSADAADGFWLAPVDEQSRWLTAFNSVMGRFEWLCTPMGLQPASGHFQRFMEDALQRHGLLYTTEDGKKRNPDTGLLEGFVAVYQDDLIWWSSDREEHREQIETFLDAMSVEELKMNPNKLNLFCRYTRYLGCIVGRKSLCMDPKKVEAVDTMATPVDTTGVRQLVGMASFYRRWLPSFASTVAPLTDMLRMRDDPTGKIDPKTKKIKKVPLDFAATWGPDQDTAVDTVKNLMTSYPVLRQFDPTKPCTLLTDGSLVGVGSVLCQEHDGKLCAVSYASHRLTSAEAKYPVTEIEGLGILHAIRTNRHFLINNPFTIRVLTDHRPLQWSNSVATRSGRLTRWLLELSDYDFRIEYIPGPKNDVADALSRLLTSTPSDATESIEFRDALKQTWNPVVAEDSVEHMSMIVAAAQIGSTSEHHEFTTSFEAASRDLIDWEDEDPDTIECLPTAWRDFADPAGFDNFASHMVNHAEILMRQQVNYTTCPDFADLFAKLSPGPTVSAAGDTQRNPRQAAAGDASTNDRRERAAGDAKTATSRMRADLHLQGEAIYTSDGLLAVPTYLRPQLMGELHSSTMAGHRGAEGTLYQLRKRFYWPKMDKDVAKFVAACDTCQQAKSRTHKAWGGARANLPPVQPFTHYTMDFMFGFPPGGGGIERFDGLMVVVDQFSKRVIALPVHEAAKADVMAEAFYRKVVCGRGTPTVLTSDRDSRFTGAFWRKLWTLHHTSLKLTPAYSPWGDGQTERMNRLLEEILRTNVQADQLNWLELCDGAVAAINAAPSDTTGKSPFELETGLAMQMPVDTQALSDQTYQNRGHGQLVRHQMVHDSGGILLDAAPYPGVYEYGLQEQHQYDHPERMRAIFQTAREAMMAAKATLNARLNKAVPDRAYQVGDMVKLKLGHYKLPTYQHKTAQKLRQRYFGNFEVTAVHSPTAIELALPAYMSRVHNVIHPEYLRLGHTNANGSYKKGVERGTGFRDIITAAFDMTTEYGVDEIVAHRHVGAPSDGNMEYLVRWENCSNLQVTWEPQSALIHAPRKVTSYQRKQRALQNVRDAEEYVPPVGSAAILVAKVPPGGGKPTRWRSVNDYRDLNLKMATASASMLNDPRRLGEKF